MTIFIITSAIFSTNVYSKPSKQKMFEAAIGYAMCSGALAISGKTNWKNDSLTLLKASKSSFQSILYYWPDLGSELDPEKVALQVFHSMEQKLPSELKAEKWALEAKCESDLLPLARIVNSN
ncbi:hypothetical protein AB6E77_14725 [Vibrio sp. 10N.247.311.18]|uniref:hypothetical protein n=1 Tax=unclassified Vibrio TaxID=2614977 RepID=UPI0035514B31